LPKKEGSIVKNVVTRAAVVLAIVLATVLAALIGGVSRAWAATCTDAQLAPRIAELMPSQGAPGYARLARGKDTIVRAYLTDRNSTSCTPTSKQTITPTSATLTVDNGDGSPVVISNYDRLDNPPTKLPATRQIYSVADPIFVVPAQELAPTLNPASFSISFTLRVKYTRTGSATEFTTTGTETNATTSPTVDQRTNAIRVLIVPMGDPNGASPQWSSAAETTLQNILTDTVRALPLPSGATPQLAFPPPTSGARYRVSGDLLDVKSLGLLKTSGTETKFCANASTWKTVQPGATGAYAGKTLKGELQERLDNYNLYNTPPADLALGVVDGAIAWKTTQGLVCDDGRAATPDPLARTSGEVGWVRVDTGTYSTPLQMELVHTLGVVDSTQFPSFHGPEIEADGGTSKGYNVLQRKLIAAVTGGLGVNDHSIMNYDTSTIPYRRDNTLTVPRDWMDGLCNLGGSETGTTPTFATCTISTAIGTDAGVAAGLTQDMYHIDGQLLDGVVTVTDANVGGGAGEFGIGPSSSPVHLLLCQGSCANPVNLRRDVPLSLSSQAPIDEDHTGPPVGSPSPDTFSVLISLQDPTVPTVTFTCAELRHNGNLVPGTNNCAIDADPDVVNTAVATPGSTVKSFTPFVPGSGELELPTPLCCNGRAIAFDGTHLYVTTAGATEGGNQNEYIHKVTTSGVIVSSAKTDITIGALGYNGATGHLYGGSYTGDEKVYEIDYNAVPDEEFGPIPLTELFTFTDDSACDGQEAQNFIDGLEYFLSGSEGRLALSGDVCDTVFLKTLAGTPAPLPSQFATNNNSGITTDGAGGLWLARLHIPVGDTRLTHVALDGSVLGELVVSGYQAEDLAYDGVSFAPTCVIWMNEATFGEPEVRAVAVPCANGGGDAIVVETRNTDFVTLYAACGLQADAATNPEVEKFSLGTYKPDANGRTIIPFTDDRYCENATVLTEASNGWSTGDGLNDSQGAADTDPPSQPPTVNIAAPLNGSRIQRGTKIHFDGSAFDSKNGEIISTLHWYDSTLPPTSPPPGGEIAGGAGTKSFDYTVPADAPIGDHVITLKATDPDGNTGQTSVTINIRPAACPTSKCP
jgi:hypothetical protein